MLDEVAKDRAAASPQPRLEEGTHMAGYEGIIGRADIDDFDAILADHATPTSTRSPTRRQGNCRRDLHVGLRAHPAGARASSTRRPRRRSGTPTTDLDWSIDVDQEKVDARGASTARTCASTARRRPRRARRSRTWGDKEWIELGDRVAELDAVAVHARRAGRADLHRADRRDRAVDRRQVLRGDAGDGRGPPRRGVRPVPRRRSSAAHYPINAHLELLLDDIIADSRWDMTYLGMQIMVEGLALAAFGFMHQITTEPLLKQLLRYVMSDEARHVAFGVLSLQEYYKRADRRPRSASARSSRSRPRCACATGSSSRRCGSAWASTGQGRDRARAAGRRRPPRSSRRMLFSKIVPNCKKLGLLDAGDGWLRHRFTELGVIQFEDWVDTGEEYADPRRGRPRPGGSRLTRRGR